MIKETLQENYQKNQDINVKELVYPYIRKWYWFIIVPFFLALFTYAYLKTVSPQYQIASTVLIKDSKSNPGGQMEILSDISGLGRLNSEGVENEIVIFKSKRLMETVVSELNLETNIFSENFLRDTELYGKTSPIVIKVLSENFPENKLKSANIKLKIKGDQLTVSSPEIPQEIHSNFSKTIKLPFANIIILKNKKYDNQKNITDLIFTIKPFQSTVQDYQKLLKVNLVNDDVSIIELSMRYPERKKAVDIINKLVEVYNREALDDKNIESRKTIDFIDSRISQIGKDLGTVENEKENFKENNNIVDIATEAGIGLQENSVAKGNQIELENQIELTNTLLNYIRSQRNYQLLPTNVGLNNSNAVSAINNYNALVIQRNTYLQDATVNNPVVVDITKQLNAIKEIIVESLEKGKQGLLLTRQNYQAEQDKILGRISKIPAQEKQFRIIERQQKIKEGLYMLLLEKRETAAISLAVTADKARIIDTAYSSLKPVAPKKILFLLGATILGLLFPFAFIYAKEIWNDKISTKADIDKLSGNKPMIGEIPSLKKGQGELLSLNDMSPMAEAFRILSTNMNFMLLKSEKGKVIFVTSSVKGEGKTFVSVNLALVLASSSKKVVLIGSDIRNPQLQRYAPEMKNAVGLTEYLHDSSVEAKDILQKTSFNPYCDIVYSGIIPPNPTELLTNGRYQLLLEELKNTYDYIVLDTAPLMLVTDSLLIADLADVTLYVTRSGYTEKSLIEFANNMMNEGKIKNFAFVLNDVKEENFGYGNKYGYGYGTEKKGLIQKIKNIFN